MSSATESLSAKVTAFATVVSAAAVVYGVATGWRAPMTAVAAHVALFLFNLAVAVNAFVVYRRSVRAHTDFNKALRGIDIAVESATWTSKKVYVTISLLNRSPDPVEVPSKGEPSLVLMLRADGRDPLYLTPGQSPVVLHGGRRTSILFSTEKDVINLGLGDGDHVVNAALEMHACGQVLVVNRFPMLVSK